MLPTRPILLLACLALPLLAACTTAAGVEDRTAIFDTAASGKPATLDVNEAAALISSYRKSKGLGPVTIDATLMQIAKVHADRMAAANTMSHVLPGEGSFQQRLVSGGFKGAMGAENIAEGQPTLASVLEAWRESPGHNANLLDPQFTEIGMALSINSSTQYKYFWALVLGSPPEANQAPGPTFVSPNGANVTIY